MSIEKSRNALNNSGSINAAAVSMALLVYLDAGNLRLTLEIFHDIKEPVVDIRLVHKAYLHLIEVAKCILKSNSS